MSVDPTLCPVQTLFPEPDAQAAALLEGYRAVLSRVRPLKARHARTLPDDVFRLSRILTAEREELTGDYLAAPGPLSAYLSYFLPWNLWRMVRLFQALGLDRDLPGNGAVADVGAGPLTVAQALWMAAPALRSRPLSFTCLDRSPKPMREGLALFDALREGREDARAWDMRCRSGGPHTRLERRADLVVCANTLNELPLEGRGMLAERVGAVAGQLVRMAAPGGRVLVIEPGVRRSGRILALLREAFLEQGLRPLAPCPHAGPCPFSAEGGRGWCHFTFETRSAPRWLTVLADKARLTKTQASLSFLYFAVEEGGRASPGSGGAAPDLPDAGPDFDWEAGEDREQDWKPEPGPVRVLSAPFDLPEGRRGRYGCSGMGATLLTWPAASPVLLRSGDLIAPAWPPADRPLDRDPKTGAVVLPLVEGADGPGARPSPQNRPEPGSPDRPGPKGADRPRPRAKDRPGPGAKDKPVPGTGDAHDKRKAHGDETAAGSGPGPDRVRKGPGRPGKPGPGSGRRGRRDPLPAGTPAGDHPGKKRRP